MHGKRLEEISAPLGSPIWLITRTVMQELDQKTHYDNGRLKRRAKGRRRSNP